MEIFISTILTAIAILMVVIGILFVVGAANQEEKKRSVWFLIAMIGGMIWSLGSATYSLKIGSNPEVMAWLSYSICVGSLIASIGLLGYSIPYIKVGYAFLIVLVPISIVLAIVPFFNSEILLPITQNQLNWFYICYGGLILLNFIATVIGAIIRVSTSLTKKNRDAAFLFLVGLIVTLVISLTFNMVFPFVLHIFNFLWVGPLSIYILVLTFYFSLFTTHRISLSSVWLKRISYAMIIFSALIVYTIIVFMVAVVILQSEINVASIIVFATIISLALLLISYAVSKLTANVRSMLMVNQIDIAYILKRLENMNVKNNYRQIATLLADHLHISYCGLLIDNHLYGSRLLNINESDLQKINKLNSTGSEIWQKPDLKLSYKLLELNLANVATLRDSNGTVLGHVLVGKPEGKLGMSRKEFLIFGMIFNFVAEKITLAKRRP